MRITNAGNVGIGTDSPAQILEVNPGTAADPIIQITNSNAAAYRPSLRLDNQATGGRSYRMFSTSGSDGVYGGGKFAIYDDDAGAGRLTIDSSGNLMVGKTAINTAGNGGELRANGQLLAIATDINPFFGARLNSDGDLIVFRKDTTTVGSIGSLTSGRDLHVNSTGGILTFESNFNSTERQVVFGDTYLGPRAADNNAVDLGRSVSQFKNLYLSGGMYVGGTGSANYLDDYEEGNWSPGVDTGTLSTGAQSTYIKIGRIVHCQCKITNFSDTTSSNSFAITNLPFTFFSSDRAAISTNVLSTNVSNTNLKDLNGYLEPGNKLRLYASVTGGGYYALRYSDLLSSSSTLYIGFSYFTDS